MRGSCLFDVPVDLISFSVFGLIGLGLLVLKVWALIDCVTAPSAAFDAHGKLSKTAWVVILVLAVLLAGRGVLDLLSLVGTVAAIVYLVDVRPAVRGLA